MEGQTVHRTARNKQIKKNETEKEREGDDRKCEPFSTDCWTNRVNQRNFSALSIFHLVSDTGTPPVLSESPTNDEAPYFAHSGRLELSLEIMSLFLLLIF